ncbi:MAG: hypothetical protein ABIS01_08510 [Ferruginibacter sp.]
MPQEVQFKRNYPQLITVENTFGKNRFQKMELNKEIAFKNLTESLAKALETAFLPVKKSLRNIHIFFSL